jgi:hypothetical protein
MAAKKSRMTSSPAASRLARIASHVLVGHHTPRRRRNDEAGRRPAAAAGGGSSSSSHHTRCSSPSSSSPFASISFTPRQDGGLDSHLDHPNPPVLPPELTAAAPPQLLTDREVQQFLVEGFCAVQVDCGEVRLHEHICERLDAVVEAEGNPTNNLVVRTKFTYAYYARVSRSCCLRCVRPAWL